MKRHARLPALLACGWLAIAAARAAPMPPADEHAALASAIEAQLASFPLEQARIGIAVVSLDSGRTLYARDAEKLFEPASTAKLFTAAAVLDRLDPAYRIPTRLLGGTPVRGRLDGPLVLYGMGDPSLGRATETRDWADHFAAALAARGVRRIEGDLIADDTYFSGPPYAPGWEAIDRLAAFAAPPGALVSQEGALEVTVAPGARAGTPALVQIEPADAQPPLQNRLVTVPADAGQDVNLYRAPGEETLHAFGRVRLGSAPVHYHLAVGDPAAAAGMQLAAALARAHIRLDGQVRALHWPADDRALLASSTEIARVQSPPLQELLADGLKRSQNLVLENLLQLVGRREQADAAGDVGAPQGFLTTQAWGVRAIDRLLARIGVPAAQCRLEEGTGLSRRDLVSPAALVRVLGYLAAQRPRAGMRELLPVAGRDGTLARRLGDLPAGSDLYAKTGSMRYVSSLAGYVTTRDGERLAFALMIEHYAPVADDAPSARLALDSIVQALATSDRDLQPASR